MRLNDSAVPLPAAYTRHLSYNQHVQGELHDPIVYVPEAKTNYIQIATKVNSVKGHDDDDDDDDDEETPESPAQKQKSLLMFLTSSRLYIRVLAILIMILSFSLILTAVIMFGKAQNKPGHPLDQVPKPAAITDHPCIVFTGVAAMNFCISVTVLSLSFISSKVHLPSSDLIPRIL